MYHTLVVPRSVWGLPALTAWLRARRRPDRFADDVLCRFLGCDEDALSNGTELPLCGLHRSYVTRLQGPEGELFEISAEIGH
jgi:hypothetical protein